MGRNSQSRNRLIGGSSSSPKQPRAEDRSGRGQSNGEPYRPVWASPDRDRNAADAARRARAKVRRYAPEPAQPPRHPDLRGRGLPRPGGIAADVGAFFRRLRRQVGEPIPYLWAPEWHKTATGSTSTLPSADPSVAAGSRLRGATGSSTSGCSATCPRVRVARRGTGGRTLPGQVRREGLGSTGGGAPSVRGRPGLPAAPCRRPRSNGP